jgi:phage shock protein E
MSLRAGAAGEPLAPTRQKENPMQVPPGIVDGATAQRLAEAGALVVDVRTPAEFAAGHVPGARNVPFDEIARRSAEIGPPSTPVVVYCKSGQRSAVARQELRRLGFEKVWDVQRYDAWPKGGGQ